MKIFITGGTGFLGGRVVARLVAAGHQVLALARSGSAGERLKSAGAIPVLGDLGGIAAWAAQLQGCDVVVHAAAPLDFWGPWPKFQRDIVDATTNLLMAATTQGVGRFVHVSSESVLQDKDDLLDVDESLPYPARPNSSYGLAKKLAEEAILAMKTPVTRVILRPTFIWGDECPAMAEVVSKVNNGAFVWVDGGRAAMEAIHVSNAAAAVVLACSRGDDGGVYFVTDDERATVREFFGRYLQALGVPVPARSVPSWIAKPAAASLEAAWRMLHLSGSPPMSRFELAFVAMNRRYNISRAKRDLGYSPEVSREAGFAAVRRLKA